MKQEEANWMETILSLQINYKGSLDKQYAPPASTKIV